MCYDGEGVPQNYAKALKWWRKALAQGNRGRIYRYGEGVDRDYVGAVKWWRKAADQGLAKAQLKLGLMYYNGDGVPQDYIEAEKWWRKAAEQGYTTAQGLHALLWTENTTEAEKWFRKAVEQGDATAQGILGVMKANAVERELRSKGQFSPIRRRNTSKGKSPLISPGGGSRDRNRKTIYDGDATDEEFDADIQRRRNRVNRVNDELDKIWREATGEEWSPSTSRRKTIYDGDATDEEFDEDIQRRRNRVNRVNDEFDKIWRESTGEEWPP